MKYTILYNKLCRLLEEQNKLGFAGEMFVI